MPFSSIVRSVLSSPSRSSSIGPVRPANVAFTIMSVESIAILAITISGEQTLIPPDAAQRFLPAGFFRLKLSSELRASSFVVAIALLIQPWNAATLVKTVGALTKQSSPPNEVAAKRVIRSDSTYGNVHPGGRRLQILLRALWCSREGIRTRIARLPRWFGVTQGRVSGH